jgi:hypothetical protein
MPKKGKWKKVEFLVDAEALAPFDVAVNDIIETPLGVTCTVIGVRDGALWLQWPGGIVSPASPAPAKATNKTELQTYGYNRRPQSAHIQRSIDDRERVRTPAPPLSHRDRSAIQSLSLPHCLSRHHGDPSRTSLSLLISKSPTRSFRFTSPPLAHRRSTSTGVTGGRGPRRRRLSCRWGRTAPSAPPPLLPLLRAVRRRGPRLRRR